ncbi:MAG: hypothetical protein JOY68_08475 [Candidatus Dormibacteraeota bacterium]|nr:hypothetical protein [Candidatus Dormibacteraeota bacterium]
MWHLNAKNAVIGVLGAAVVGLGSVVAVDHLSSPSAAPASAVVTASQGDAFHVGAFQMGAAAAFMQLEAAGTSSKQLLQQVIADFGVPPAQIMADLKAGKTLAQIAGANTGKVESALAAALKGELNKAVTSGAITASQESRLLADASDAIDVLMNAKLSSLHLGR